MVAHAQFGIMPNESKNEIRKCNNKCMQSTNNRAIFKCILDFWVTQWRRVRVSQDIVELLQKVKFFHFSGTCKIRNMWPCPVLRTK